MDIKVQIRDQKVQQLMDALVHRSSDLSPAMEAIAHLLESGIEAAFSASKSPEGPPWAPLSEAAIQQRARRGYWPGSLLQQTGRLAASITAAHGKDYAVAGTNVIYATTHQFGAKKGSFGITSRGSPNPLGRIFQHGLSWVYQREDAPRSGTLLPAILSPQADFLSSPCPGERKIRVPSCSWFRLSAESLIK